MIEITSSTYIDGRTGSKMFQLTLKKDGVISSVTTDYLNLNNKQNAEQELCKMTTSLCDKVYRSIKD